MNPIKIRVSILGASAAVVLLAGCDASQPVDGALAPAPACGLPAAPVTVQAEKPCSERSDARVVAMSDDGIGLTSELGLPPGRYALPATATPTQLVVMFHGHQNDSCSWRDHLREVAARGGIAVAMDYTGQVDREVDGFGFVENWGWFVRSGADDSITAARHFLDRYPTITQVINFGTSMGGNTSGYAAYSADAVRADCSPLWDYWIATEGVHNLTEEYTGARTLAPGNTTAAQAQLEIEEENGGTLESVPERYAEITTVAHAAELAYLRGAVFAHGTTDQTVPFDQSTQMTDGLRANGVPVRFYQVVPSDHVWEGDGSTQVMKLGLDALYALMAGGTVADGDEPVAGP
jgi:hypothetical protein